MHKRKIGEVEINDAEDKKQKKTSDSVETIAKDETETPKKDSAAIRSVYWDDNLSVLCLIDQRKLPQKFLIHKCTSYEDVAQSIKVMIVRGAPAIGAAAAFGMVLAAMDVTITDTEHLLNTLKIAKDTLDKSRPTAVNLVWATARVMNLAKLLASHNVSANIIKRQLLVEAKHLSEDDVTINKRLGMFGSKLVKPGSNIMHHCNTGRLATVDYGTALGVIYTAHEQKKNIHVWVNETRPRLQGSRLTSWELRRAGVPMHLNVDSAAGLLMHTGKVDIVLYGADRVAANGDVANKIGSYSLSVLAKENGIPVYACVPASTIDLKILTGKDIPIEERNGNEIRTMGGVQIAPDNCPIYNPAFDITPSRYLTGIITEEGVCYPPFEETLKQVKEKSEFRIQSEMNERLQRALSNVQKKK